MIVDTAGIFADGGAYVPTQEKKKINAFSPLGGSRAHTRKKGERIFAIWPAKCPHKKKKIN